jgi:hypothetical protein
VPYVTSPVFFPLYPSLCVVTTLVVTLMGSTTCEQVLRDFVTTAQIPGNLLWYYPSGINQFAANEFLKM